MLINALNDYYDILEQKGRIPPSGVSSQPISHMIMLSQDGRITDIIDIRAEEKVSDKKSRYVNIPMQLPERTQKPGIDFNIIEHRPLYIFGLNYDKKSGSFSPEDKTGKAKKSHDCFVRGNLEFIDGMNSDIVNAYRKFIESWEPEKETENRQLIRIAKDYPTAYFCFALEGHPEIKLHDTNGEIMKKVRSSVKQAADADGICAISGRPAKIARLHDKIKGIRGGQAAGGLIVCFNSSAEESYGKTQSYNSSISEDVMKRYTAALNVLVSDKAHRIYIDDLTVVFWAMSSDDDKPVELYLSFLNGDYDTDDGKADADTINVFIKKALEALRDGRQIDLSELDIDESVTFYTVGLAPNNSRISQKFLYRDEFGKVFRNAVMHQADMNIDGSHGQLPLWRILSELKAPASKTEKVPPPLIAGIFRAVMTGTQYPEAMLDTAVRRVKTDGKLNYARAGIIKACLNRKIRMRKERKEFTMSLDKENTNKGYVCGRLFAVLEMVQENAADGKLNRTIKDTYYSSASSNPASVFPELMALANHHLSKIKSKNEGGFIFYDKLFGEIISKLDITFPKALNIDDQGAFTVGYYHQRTELFKKNNENNGTNK